MQPHPRARARPCAGRRLPAGIDSASESVAARENRGTVISNPLPSREESGELPKRGRLLGVPQVGAGGIEDAVDLPQKMIRRNPVVEAKFVEQPLLHPCLLPHRPRVPQPF